MKAGLLLIASVTLAIAVVGQKPVRKVYDKLVVKTSAPAAAAAAAPLAIDPATIRPMQVGMNTTLIAYWSQEDPYSDPIRSHLEFKVGGPGGPDLIDQYKRDQGGWPVDLPKDVNLVAFIGDTRAIPKGADCRVSAGWRVQTGTNAIVEQQGQKWKFRSDVSPGGFAFYVSPEHDHASLTELSCQPNDIPAGQLFRPAFLKDLAPFQVIRFMNWMKANGEPPATWSRRPTPSDISIVKSGISVEHMVMLANINHSDPWFCLPFDADDDYVRKFAAYVRDHLASDRIAYVELSNEVWNSQFPQGRQAIALGKAKYSSENESTAANFFYADRVRGVMDIWKQTFVGQSHRLVRVLGSQAAWAGRSADLLAHEETWRAVDAVAIAPYFGEAIPAIAGSGPARLDTIFSNGPKYVETSINWAKAHKAIANKYKLRLIAYEGGPGFEAFTPKDNVDMTALQHDKRFYDMYTLFLSRWHHEIGDVFMAYDSIGPGYGHLDYTGAPWDGAPKMRAISDYAKRTRSHPQAGSGVRD